MGHHHAMDNNAKHKPEINPCSKITSLFLFKQVRNKYCYNSLFAFELFEVLEASSLLRWLNGLGEPGRVFPSIGEFFGVSQVSKDEGSVVLDCTAAAGIIAKLFEPSRGIEVTIGLA